jgi:hypothetical protein
MDEITSAPIRYGLIRLIRSFSADIVPPLRGGIHESVARRKVPYPFIILTEVSAPVVRDPGGEKNKGHVTIDALYDVIVTALKTVDADNIDKLLANRLSDHEDDLQPFVVGQNVQRIDRVAHPPTGPERDATGQWIVRRGGTYRIVTDTPIALTP